MATCPRWSSDGSRSSSTKGVHPAESRTVASADALSQLSRACRNTPSCSRKRRLPRASCGRRQEPTQAASHAWRRGARDAWHRPCTVPPSGEHDSCVQASEDREPVWLRPSARVAAGGASQADARLASLRRAAAASGWLLRRASCKADPGAVAREAYAGGPRPAASCFAGSAGSLA